MKLRKTKREQERARLFQLVRAAQSRSRSTPEYAIGYNSATWIDGRNEGFQLALEAINETLKEGQWAEPVNETPSI